jgi:hypothetical protein
LSGPEKETLLSDTDLKTTSILVLGAGELGMAVLRALSEVRGQTSRSGLAVLLRPIYERDASERDRTLRALGVQIVRADLATETADRLSAIFASFSTVICCTGFVGGSGTQRNITAAVLDAGVERYVPWQFGVDYDVVGRGSGQDVWDEQLDVREMLRAQSRTRWTIISTGMFTSFLFEPSFGLVDLENNRVHALGSWENQVTVTTPEDIGQLTAAILFSEPQLNDEVVFVAGDTISYRELADTVDRVLSRKVDRILWSIAQLRSDLEAHPNDGMLKYRLAFARDNGVAWPKERTFNAERRIAVVDVPTWLRAWRDDEATPNAAGTSMQLR